jgi:mRNA-degrading endonuclease YafQ of YafQ-DinJ toxin-antitoxin module
MELIFKSKFKRNSQTLVRWNIKLKEKIENCIIDFSENILNSKFYRKPLKNLWKNIHELEIWWDIRILIELLIIEEKCYFLNIWTHSSLNLVWNKKVKL